MHVQICAEDPLNKSNEPGKRPRKGRTIPSWLKPVTASFKMPLPEQALDYHQYARRIHDEARKFYENSPKVQEKFKRFVHLRNEALYISWATQKLIPLKEFYDIALTTPETQYLRNEYCGLTTQYLRNKTEQNLIQKAAAKLWSENWYDTLADLRKILEGY